MANVVFVHGTGVREPAYTESFRLVELGLSDHSVTRCYWGDSQGVRLLGRFPLLPIR